MKKIIPLYEELFKALNEDGDGGGSGGDIGGGVATTSSANGTGMGNVNPAIPSTNVGYLNGCNFNGTIGSGDKIASFPKNKPYVKKQAPIKKRKKKEKKD